MDSYIIILATIRTLNRGQNILFCFVSDVIYEVHM